MAREVDKVRPASFAVFLAAAILAGCGGSQSALGTPGALPRSSSWVARQAKGGDLLYISDLGANAVDVYTYPQAKAVGKLTGFGDVATLCANRAGDIFVVDGDGPIDVYAHGGASPIRTLQDSGLPNGCSVDPVTGDLAVTNESSYLYGTIAIYKNAQGNARKYFNDKVDATFFCGYDKNGNLFMDGWNRSGVVIFLELPKGSKTIRIMNLGRSVKNPGGVQWDGKYIALSDQGAGLIYRTNSDGTVAQTVKLHDGDDVDQFAIQNSVLVGPNAASNGTVPFWHYPAGGSPIMAIKGSIYPIGATVSLAHRSL